MLFFKTLVTVAIFLGLTGAIPISDDDDNNNNDFSPALFLLNDSQDVEMPNALVARDNCVTFNEVVNKLANNIDILAYLSTGYYSTLYVCKRMNKAHCEEAAKAVGSAFAAIAFITGRVLGALPKDVEEHQNQGQNQNETLAGFLRETLSGEGEVFGSINDLTHTRDAKDENAPLEIASVRNWNYNGALVNFDVHDFGGGGGHVLVPLGDNNGTGHAAAAASGTTTAEEGYSVKVGKAPGFKVSYMTREKTKLSKAQINDMANAAAADWASHAKDYDKMSNYIGLWKTGHKANFYYRVIPEVENFGNNYESVDVCGNMAQFL